MPNGQPLFVVIESGCFPWSLFCCFKKHRWFKMKSGMLVCERCGALGEVTE